MKQSADRARIDAEQREQIAKWAKENPLTVEPRKSSRSGHGHPRVSRLPDGVSVEDFYAYLPQHRYLFAPTRELWPASSVNASVPAVLLADGRPLRPSDWLDLHRRIQQVTWAPGEPPVILGRLIADGGWIAKPSCQTFNLYRPPVLMDGDAQQASRWLEHVEYVYGKDAGHIVCWLAHRVQRPGEKINHALVLGGAQGIGKDTILEPVRQAVGECNFVDVSPTHMLGRFNGFVKSVILRVSEVRDLGDVDRYAYYDHMKPYIAAPPSALRCDEKNIREHYVPNVTGVIFTTNHKAGGIHLPPDDRRHFVAWSDRTRDNFADYYFESLWRWFAEGGSGHVAAYLRSMDLSGFNAKQPPPRTPAFLDIVDAGRAPEDAGLADAIDRLGKPLVLTLAELMKEADELTRDWLADRRIRRQVPHRLESCGYSPVRNKASDGLWKLRGARQVIYGRTDASERERLAAASAKAASR